MAPTAAQSNPQPVDASPLPTGTVTFFFSDVEGSTRLLQADPDGFPRLIADHFRLTRHSMAEHGGVVVRTEGDAFFAAFDEAAAAVAACVDIQRAHFGHPWPPGREVRVRMGIHTGSGRRGGDDYLGLDVHRAARVAAAGHGGQVVLSEATKALVAGALPVGVQLADLGEHRLKDLANPEHLYQLVIEGLPAGFPPLRTLDAIPNNLPIQLTSFIDRAELPAVVALLEKERLITLTGPGGTGKSRLALQAAGAVAHLFDGVWFVPLAAVDDPALVAPRILNALGVPLSKEPPEQQLAAYLRDAHLLLLLDNFEQVLGAAPLVASLLASAPRLTVLATSRAPLHIAGEHEFPIPPLRVPDPGDVAEPGRLRQVGSVALFLDRAQAVRPDFGLDERNAAAVADIVTRLDGLPLALELAAARVKLLPPQAMLKRLSAALDLPGEGARRDVPDRQRTLRGAIAWSYGLLTPEGAKFFRTLAVFRGGATLEAIEAVCSPASGARLLEDLAALVDHSLVQVADVDSESPRYSMLTTIREFAAEKLAESEDVDEVRLRHLQFYRALAEEGAAHLVSSQQALWLQRLERDHDNLRGALAWAIETTNTAEACLLMSALWRFFHMRGPLREGRELAERILVMPIPVVEHRLAALDAAGGLAYWHGDFPAAERHYQEALELSRRLGDPARVLGALYNLAFPLSLGHDRRAAEVVLDEAAGLAAELGDGAAAARIEWARGDAAFFAEDYEAAQERFRSALAALTDSDQKFMEAWGHRMLGITLLKLGGTAEAREHLQAGLGHFADVGDASGMLLHLSDFVTLALLESDYERALVLWGAFSRHEQQSGLGLANIAQDGLPDVSPALAALGEARAQSLLDRGAALSLADAVACARGRRALPAA